MDTYKQPTLESTSCAAFDSLTVGLRTCSHSRSYRAWREEERFTAVACHFSPSLPNLLSRTASEFTESQLSHSDQQSQWLLIISQGY